MTLLAGPGGVFASAAPCRAGRSSLGRLAAPSVGPVRNDGFLPRLGKEAEMERESEAQGPPPRADSPLRPLPLRGPATDWQDSTEGGGFSRAFRARALSPGGKAELSTEPRQPARLSCFPPAEGFFCFSGGFQRGSSRSRHDPANRHDFP